MYRLSEEIDICILEDQVLSQISFGINYIQLSFNNSSIQFSGPFLFKSGEQKHERDEVFPINSDFGLLFLLEKKIQSVNSNEEKTSLTLKFDENLFLVLKSNEMYECFEINIAGTRVIV
jgi:hypothetical protein